MRPVIVGLLVGADVGAAGDGEAECSRAGGWEGSEGTVVGLEEGLEGVEVEKDEV